MSETDRLRDLLEQTAPRSPDLTAPERAAAVVRRGRAARRRDQALVGVATVAVLAAALGVPLALAGDEPQQATPAPAPTVAEPCPAAPVDVAGLGAAPDPGEVVAVRSCPTSDKPVTPLPTEPLLDDEAAAFLADVEAMPAYQMPPMCMVMSIAAEPWALQLQTADGEIVLIGSTMRVCSSVELAGTARAVDHVVAAFLGNLAGQPDALACPTGDGPAVAPTWNASFDPTTAVAGVFCTNPADWRAPGAGWTGHELGADDLALVRDDLAANLGTAGPGDSTCFDPADERLLVLADADGDQSAYLDQGCIDEFASARGYWTPGPAAAAIIGR